MKLIKIFFALLLPAISLFAQINDDFAGYYLGTFPNGASVCLNVSVDEEEYFGTFYVLGDTSLYGFTGMAKIERLSLYSYPPETSLKIEAVKANTTDLDASVLLLGKKYAIRFSKMSSLARIQDNRGTINLYAEYPKFIVPNPAFLELSQEFKRSISGSLVKFVEHIEEEAQSGRGLETLEWEKEIYYDISYANQNFVSILIRTYELAEGNVFRSFYSAAQYKIDKNEAIAVGLRDLFEKRQDALQEINAYIIEYLKNTNNQFAKKGIIKYFDESQLSAFVVNQSGLQFYFPPGVISESLEYESVIVPFEVVEDFVGKTSPLTHIIKFY